ncbi:MAG: HAD family hydrolase [Atopobiaceae bacterium]
MVAPAGLICCDLDGTLLDPAKQIVPEVRSAIAEAEASGCIVAVASGRHPFNVFELMDGLGLPRTCTCLSGAATFEEGTLIQSNPLPASAVRSVIALAEHLDCYLAASGADFNLTFGHIVRPAKDRKGAVSRYAIAESWDDLARRAEARMGSILKLALHAEDDGSYSRIREGLRCISGICSAQSDIRWVDVTAPGCTKAAGIRALREELGIPAERVAVLGDDENDLEALASAGLAVCPANAIPEAKRIADLVVADNAHAGAAEGIRAAIEAFTQR